MIQYTAIIIVQRVAISQPNSKTKDFYFGTVRSSDKNGVEAAETTFSYDTELFQTRTVAIRECEKFARWKKLKIKKIDDRT